MIYLTTGLPGSGKTLWTLWHVEALRKAENRTVYFYNIALDTDKLPWIPLNDEEVLKWFELPAGSIIVIDEAQKIFRPRPPASAVPAHESHLETHRHQGHDLFLITQHPSLIGSNVRRLVETHRHMMRLMGFGAVSINEWKGVKDQCDKNRNDAIKSTWKYPKQVFTWYKSAEVHTAKIRIPFKVVFLALSPFLLGYLAYSIYSRHFAPKEPDPVALAADGSPLALGGPSRVSQVTAIEKHDSEHMAEWLADQKPRLDEMPWTSPKYDGITTPVRAPVYEGCVVFGGEGFCFLAGAIKRKVSLDFAQNFINNGGVFIDFKPEPQQLQNQNANGGTERSAVRGAAPT